MVRNRGAGLTIRWQRRPWHLLRDTDPWFVFPQGQAKEDTHLVFKQAELEMTTAAKSESSKTKQSFVLVLMQHGGIFLLACPFLQICNGKL